MKKQYLYLLAPLFIGLQACSSDSDYDFDAEDEARAPALAAAKAPEATFDPANGIIPFPNSVLFGGSEDGTLNAPVENPENLADPAVALNMMDGFSTSSPIVTPVSNALDVDSLIMGDTIRVFLLDTDAAGTVTGLGTEIAPASMLATQSGGNLVLLPLTPLQGASDYAVFLTNGISGENGKPLDSALAYRLIRGNTELTGATAALEPVRQITRPLISLFEAAELDGTINGESTMLTARNVSMSWSFRTVSIRETLQAVKDITVPSTLAVGPSGQDTSAIGLQGKANIYIGALTVPYYQTAANSPAEAGVALNSFWKDGAGNVVTRYTPTPAPTGSETIPVIMSVPNANSAGGGVEPETGWPITVYQHGITRNRTDMLAVADAMADAGIVVIAIDIPMHGLTDSSNPFHADNTPAAERERTFNIDVLTHDANGNVTAAEPDGTADPSGQHFYNLTNLVNARDNLRQGAADLMVLSASLDSIQGVNLDTSKKTFIGHSLGGIIGTTFLSYDDSFSAASIAMSGAGIAQLLANSERFGPILNGGLAAAGIETGSADYQKFLTVAQTVIDSGDPINHARFIPEASVPAVHFMEVIGDQVIPNLVATAPLSGTEPMARELGLTAVDADTTGSALVRFSAGDHGSIINPAGSLETTIEMQRQVATFAVSQGQTIDIEDTSVIQPADQPPVPPAPTVETAQ
ncbi:MAG: hypothetical protein V3U76_14405 [Granulosicoccus sp.]